MLHSAFMLPADMSPNLQKNVLGYNNELLIVKRLLE